MNTNPSLAAWNKRRFVAVSDRRAGPASESQPQPAMVSPAVVETDSGNGSSVPAPESHSRQTTSKATGPLTPVGKEKSKHNATKHGIFSKAALLKNESRSDFDSLLSGLQDALQPAGMLEEILVDKLATLSWRYRRLMIAEASEIGIESVGLVRMMAETTPDSFRSVSATPQLERFLKYEAGLERNFDRALTQLERLQRMRFGQPVTPPIKLDVSQS